MGFYGGGGRFKKSYGIYRLFLAFAGYGTGLNGLTIIGCPGAYIAIKNGFSTFYGSYPIRAFWTNGFYKLI